MAIKLDVTHNHKIEFTGMPNMDKELGSLSEVVAKMQESLAGGGGGGHQPPTSTTVNGTPLPPNSQSPYSGGGGLSSITSQVTEVTNSLQRLTSALTGATTKINNLTGVGGGGGLQTPTSTTVNGTPLPPNSQSPHSGGGGLSSITSQVTEVTNALQRLTTSLTATTTKINNLTGVSGGADGAGTATRSASENYTYRYAGEMGKQDAVTEARARRIEAENKVEDERSWGKFSKGMLLGAGTAIAYQAGGFGSAFGASANAMNTSAGDYINFQRSLYNDQQGKFANMASTGISMGATGLGAMLGGPIGAVIGMGVGALGNYTVNKYSEEDKARNSFMLQNDMNSWQLQKAGLSSTAGGRTMGGKAWLDSGAKEFKATSLQEEAWKISPEFAAMTPAVVMDARRDVMAGMSDAQKAKYGVNVQELAMSSRTDLGALNKVASNYAAFTGQDPVKAMEKLADNYVKYGGDTATNTAKMLQIMTTTPYGANQAADLAWRYQNNDAYLSNRISASQNAPINNLTGDITAKAFFHTSEKEIGMLREGIMPDRLKKMYEASKKSRDPGTQIIGQILATMFAEYGINPNVNQIGLVKANQKGADIVKNAADEPASMSQFRKEVVEALRGINTINTDSLVVYPNSMIENAPVMTKMSSSSRYPMTKSTIPTGTKASSSSEPTTHVAALDGKVYGPDGLVIMPGGKGRK